VIAGEFWGIAIAVLKEFANEEEMKELTAHCPLPIKGLFLRSRSIS